MVLGKLHSHTQKNEVVSFLTKVFLFFLSPLEVIYSHPAFSGQGDVIQSHASLLGGIFEKSQSLRRKRSFLFPSAMVTVNISDGACPIISLGLGNKIAWDRIHSRPSQKKIFVTILESFFTAV